MLKLDTATEIFDSFKPETVEDYRKNFRLHMLRTNRIEQPQGQPLKAGIDCGRWVVNCVCGGGIAIHPSWQFAACFTCGRSWSSIIFPSEEFLAQLEPILKARAAGAIRRDPRRFGSWWPEETLEDLRRENIRHGWSVPEA